MAEVDAGVPTPAEVVTPPAADAVIAPETPTPPEQATDEPVQPPKTFTEEEVRKTVNDRLTKERRRLEKQVRLEMENDALRRQIESSKPVTQPAGKPREEDFVGKPYSEFVDALTQWRAEQIADQRLAKVREEAQAQMREQSARQQMAEASKKLMQGANKYSDFQEVVGADDVPFTPAMGLAITKVPNSADVAYYLATNRNEADEIASLSDIEQVWRIRDVSTKLSSSAPTKTSAPIVPNRGSSSGTKSMLDMNQDEFEKHRRAHLARK